MTQAYRGLKDDVLLVEIPASNGHYEPYAPIYDRYARALGTIVRRRSKQSFEGLMPFANAKPGTCD
jgi:hypothetical protein